MKANRYLCITGSPVKNLIRNSIKLSLAVALPLVLFSFARHLSVVENVVIGLKAMSIDRFGTPAQLQALVDDTARESAVRGGTLESYLGGEKVANAMRAMRELDTQNPLMADNLFEITRQQCHPRPGHGTGVALEHQACKCVDSRVK